MTNALNQLREMTVVVADTGDVAAVRAYAPVDCTTNPSIVLAALKDPASEELATREIEDGKNVFICLATMENPDGELRPGMRGKARVSAGLRPFGWILFHKPIDFVRLHL